MTQKLSFQILTEIINKKTTCMGGNSLRQNASKVFATCMKYS